MVNAVSILRRLFVAITFKSVTLTDLHNTTHFRPTTSDLSTISQ